MNRLLAASVDSQSHATTLIAPLATVLAALIAAFLGSWIGAIAALSQFKRQRAFDRQLDWYERIIRALHEMALRVDIAVTAKDDSSSSREMLSAVWRKVQRCHIELERLVSEAPLYASKEATKRSDRISGEVQKVAEETEAFDPINHSLTEEQMELIVGLTEKLRRAAKPLAIEARRHLGME